MTTAIALCSRALLMIGASPIHALDEETAEAQVADSFYALVRDALLAGYPWTFAMRQESLPRLTAAPPGDWQHAYQLPSDAVMIRSLGTAARSRGVTYERVGDAVYTDAAEVLISYVRRVPENAMPAYFQLALVYQLAAQFSIPLTESTGRWQAMQQAADRSLAQARRIDAQQDTPQAIDSWPLVEARG